MPSRTAIGGLLLEAVEGWSFRMQDGLIAGRRENDPGILRIMSVAPNDLPQPVTHEHCLALAQRFAEAPHAEPFARQMFESVCGPFGAASVVRDRDQLRIWYCCRPAGLIIGVYGCRAEACGSSAYRSVTVQCARMILSAVFDRPSWGADDELTKFLTAQLEPYQQPPINVPAGLPDAATRELPREG